MYNWEMHNVSEQARLFLNLRQPCEYIHVNKNWQKKGKYQEKSHGGHTYSIPFKITFSVTILWSGDQ